MASGEAARSTEPAQGREQACGRCWGGSTPASPQSHGGTQACQRPLSWGLQWCTGAGGSAQGSGQQGVRSHPLGHWPALVTTRLAVLCQQAHGYGGHDLLHPRGVSVLRVTRAPAFEPCMFGRPWRREISMSRSSEDTRSWPGFWRLSPTCSRLCLHGVRCTSRRLLWTGRTWLCPGERSRRLCWEWGPRSCRCLGGGAASRPRAPCPRQHPASVVAGQDHARAGPRRAWRPSSQEACLSVAEAGSMQQQGPLKRTQLYSNFTPGAFPRPQGRLPSQDDAQGWSLSRLKQICWWVICGDIWASLPQLRGSRPGGW